MHEPRIWHGRAQRARASGTNAICTGRGGGASGSAWPVLPPRPANSWRPAMRVSRSPSPDTGAMRRRLDEEREVREMRERERRWERDGDGGGATGGGRGGMGKARERDIGGRQAVRAELVKNGRDYLRLRGESIGAVRDEQVWEFCQQFAVEKVLRDDLGIYVTFRDVGTARRAERVLGGRMLGFHAVTLAVQPPPLPEAATRVWWDDAELVERAQELICKELKDYLEKDISDRLVVMQLRRIATEQRGRDAGGADAGRDGEGDRPAPACRDLKTLSFKKQRKDAEAEVPVEEHEEQPEEEVVVERPKTKRKEVVKRQWKVVEEVDVESEDDEQQADELWARRYTAFVLSLTLNNLPSRAAASPCPGIRTIPI